MTDYVYLDDEEILKDNILDSKCRIVHLKRRTQGYFIHIVCCQFSDEQSLEKNWEEIINNVANAIQKNLKELIEIFNIYILFFQPECDAVMAYQIEQNKFLSRKLVMEQQMPEENEKLELILSEKLFDLNIEMDNKASELFVDEMDFLNSYEGEECEHKLEQYIVDQIKGEFR